MRLGKREAALGRWGWDWDWKGSRGWVGRIWDEETGALEGGKWDCDCDWDSDWSAVCCSWLARSRSICWLGLSEAEDEEEAEEASLSVGEADRGGGEVVERAGASAMETSFEVVEAASSSGSGDFEGDREDELSASASLSSSASDSVGSECESFGVSGRYLAGDLLAERLLSFLVSGAGPVVGDGLLVFSWMLAFGGPSFGPGCETVLVGDVASRDFSVDATSALVFAFEALSSVSSADSEE